MGCGHLRSVGLTGIDPLAALGGTVALHSAYPVDSHHVDELKGYSRTAINMQTELEKSGVHINRNRPDLLWVVQNFNFYNLDNSGMTGDDLLGNLTDSMLLNTLGMADERLENLHGMFNTKSMAPVHRPHDSDKVRQAVRVRSWWSWSGFSPLHCMAEAGRGLKSVQRGIQWR